LTDSDVELAQRTAEAGGRGAAVQDCAATLLSVAHSHRLVVAVKVCMSGLAPPASGYYGIDYFFMFFFWSVPRIPVLHASMFIWEEQT